MPQSDQPILKVVNADTTPEEIAAVVFGALGSSGDAAPAGRPVPEWSAHRRKVRRTLPSGPGG